jgi:endonuclease/exonuclease/phosphatase family metal-dependent hydrolase
MPFYQKINPKEEWGKRTLDRLLKLREALKEIPERTQKETLLLATWNIREFDSSKYGKRMDEAIYYIAEIIDRFDLVAVQEVRKDLEGLDRLMSILGGHWEYIFTDTTEGRLGNEERMAFLYDRRKISFGGLAGELVLPPVKVKGELKPVTQLARTPFMCGFKSGWTRFILATVHILWGEEKAEPPERISEIRQVAQFLKKRTLDETAWARNLILLGDFNIFKPENATFKELEKAGFSVPEQIKKFPSNALKTRHYDQIAFRVRENSLDLTGKAGVFDFYKIVYKATAEDQETYKPYMLPDYEGKGGKPRSETGKRSYYRDWRTHQMSDHLPMWVELKIDYSDEYLQAKLEHST